MIGFLLLTIFSLGGYAQKAEREYLRKGNKAFNDTAYVNAEVYYRKALEVNPKSSTAMYNLGNTLMMEQKFQEAMDQYQAAANIEKNKNKLSHIHHNGGVIFHAGQDYAKAIEMYKEALRNNPYDDETRYNLALAQYMLENGGGEDQNQDNEDQDQNEDQQDQQQNQDQQDQEQQQDQQDQNQDQQQNENEMSRENAEQLLNSVMQDEKEVQDKVKQQQVIRGRELDKDW
ncbi:MAG: tetratricopeptide repeat protein [Bacteroides sp.]|nr:tetratricopeptide repeat protein [Bacteroides sp.]